MKYRIHIIKVEVAKIIISIITYFFPLSLFQSIYLRSGSITSARFLQSKIVWCLQKKEVTDLFDHGKYIVFKENKNEFSAFNMCYMADALGKALFAISMNCFPKFEFLDMEGENYYATFFVQSDNQLFKDEICVDKKYNYSKCNMPGPSWKLKEIEKRAYHKVYNYFFTIKPSIKNEFSRELESIRNFLPDNGAKIIGIVARGTDYLILKPIGHPIQPSLDNLFNYISSILGENDYIYLATDEKKILESFYSKFGENRIITSESMYYDDVYNMKNANISRLQFERKNDKYLKGKQYFKRIYILANCDGLVAGMSGATRLALIINEKYKIKNIIYLGLYH